MTIKRDHYSFVISDENIESLKKILRCKISMLASSVIEVNNDVISSHYFALQATPIGWLNLTSDWGDTPKTYLDFWTFDVVFSEQPLKIVKTSTNNENIFAKTWSNINLSDPIDELIKISIYSYGDRNEAESVHCDRGIKFLGRNGNSFSLITPNGIIGWMELRTTKNSQEEILSQFQLRKEIIATNPS